MPEFKEIEYRGTLVKVSRQGDVIWNGTLRNRYYNDDGYAVCASDILPPPKRSGNSCQILLKLLMVGAAQT